MTLKQLAPMLLLALSASASAACQRQTPVTFNTPAQRMDQALQDFAHKTGCVVQIDVRQTQGKQVPAVSGQHRPAEALDLMLRRSGFVFTANQEGYVVTPWKP